jgi:hypothetical protein
LLSYDECPYYEHREDIGYCDLSGESCLVEAGYDCEILETLEEE